MSDWIHSLTFRLIVGFVSVLALALAGVGAYASWATRQELEEFEADTAVARVSRLESVVADAYDEQRPEMSLLEPTLRNAAKLFNWRIAVLDSGGNMIAGSHNFRGEMRIDSYFQSTRISRRPIVVDGRVIGELVFQAPQPLPHQLFQSGGYVLTVEGVETFGDRAPARPRPEQLISDPSQAGIAELQDLSDDALESPVDPQLSRLAASFNQSLIYAGFAAAAAGILVIALTTQRTLAPVHVLTRAARILGGGDFTMRVPVKGRDEVGELGRTFNDMAAQLQDAEAIRRSMTADVAHELRTPLSNLQGYLEAIKDGIVEPDGETVASLHDQVLHLSKLVEDLRLVAMMESGSLRMEMTAGDIGDIADLTVDSFQPRAAERGITLGIEKADGLPEMVIDHTRMRQVLANLIENAVNYTPDDGKIDVRVTASPQGNAVLLTVTDTGPGIPADDLAHVFDRLYRVDHSRNRATGGAGLGLTIVKQLVEAHGGTVSAESPAHPDGGGSRFVVSLPVVRF